jgi:RNA polymerase sigma factor (sigma-70 family)
MGHQSCEDERVTVQDGTLVLGALNGDQAAFAELYDRRARLIRAICYDQTHDSHLAADLTQEVFLRAYKNLRRLHDPDKFTAWLVAIARRVCHDWRRKQRREERATTGLTEQQIQADRQAGPPDDCLLELRDAIAGRLTQEGRHPSLTQQERLALHAFYLQGRSVEEARGVLGLSRSGFYRVLSSACERLRKVFEGRMSPEICRAVNGASPHGEVQP